MRSIDLRSFLLKSLPVTKVGFGDLPFDDFDFIRFFLDGFEGRFNMKLTFLGMFVALPTIFVDIPIRLQRLIGGTYFRPTICVVSRRFTFITDVHFPYFFS